jgi:hypothetical protein
MVQRKQRYGSAPPTLNDSVLSDAKSLQGGALMPPDLTISLRKNLEPQTD